MATQAPTLGSSALPMAASPREPASQPVNWHEADDAVLIQHIARGETHAFEILMRRHNQKLYRAARSILLNDADAEEAVQEAWWKAYSHFAEFRGDAKPSTWLTRIAVNEALMRRRRNKTREAVIQSTDGTQFNDDDMPARETSASETTQPDARLQTTELRHALEQQIDALPEIYRTAFMLCGVDQMSAKDAAKALGLRAVTVRVRYMRARRMLRNALARQLDIDNARAFSFAGERCDRIVSGVQQRVQKNTRPQSPRPPA